jgi:PAS domain S-box-containing protein
VAIQDITDIKRAEQALRQSQAQLQTILENLTEGLVVASLDGQLCHWNRAALEMHGFGSIDECMRKLPEFADTFELATIDGTILPVEQWPLARILRGERLRDLEICIRHLSSNRQRIFNYGGALVLDAQGQPLLAVVSVKDTTEHKQAEQALRESREDLNRAQAVAHTGSWRLDVRRNELLWSDENHRIFGIPEGTPLTYETFLGTVHPEDREYVHEKWSAGLRGEHYDIEHRIVLGDTVKWVRERAELEFDNEGVLLGGFGTTQDITERKQAEQALRRAKEEWEQTFNIVPDLLALLDDQHRIVRVNRAMADRLGLAPEQCVGLSCHEAVHGTPGVPGFCPLVLTCQNGREHVVEMYESRLGGHFLVSTTPRFDEEGRVTGAVHVARDITALKRAEALLRTRLRLSELAQHAGMEELIQVALDDAELHTGSCIGYFHFVDEDQENLTLHAWSANTLKNMCRAEGKGMHYPISKAGVWVDCFHARAPVIHNDYPGLPYRKGLPEGHAPIVREMAFPVVRGDSVVAIMGVGNKATDYTQDDMNALQELASLTMDLLAYKRAEEALRDSEARFRLLSETASRLLASEDPQGIVEELCREVMANLDCQAFFNFLVDERAGRLHLNACAGIPEEEAMKIQWLDYGVAVCGCAARDGERIVAEDIFNTPDLRTELVKSYGIQAYCCHPLTAQGRLIGTLSFGTKTRTRFSLEDLALMKTVADQVAVAMERIKLIGELRQSRDELELRVYERTEELQKANETLRGQEEEISKARLMLQIIFDGISDPLLMVDKELVVRMLNRASCRYFELTNIQEAIGKTCYQLVGEKCPSCDECDISLAVSAGKSVTCERKGLFDPERVEQITVYPVDEAASGFSGAIVRISDITESRNLEKHIMHVDRLSSLGQLSGGIAHEIRNPLAAINLFLDVLSDEEKFKRTSQELDILEETKSNIKKINGIIKRVLDFSRQSESAPHSKVEVGELIEDSLKLWRSRTAKSGLELRVFIEDDLPGVLGDPIEIQQVLNNLLQNAIEAMSRGGVLSITARKDVLQVDKTRRAVIVSIQDNGSGIPVNLQKSIFNPFFTTKPTGTGLGLAISHRIISRHRGVISFESKPDVGTTFCLELPAVS